MHASSQQIRELASAAQQGDRASSEELLRVVRPSVLRYLLARGCPDPEDVAQDVCLALLTAVQSWEDTGRPFWALVFAITHNKVVDALRRHTARRETAMDDLTAGMLAGHDVGPPEQIEQDEGAARVQALLASLPATQRDVLLLRVIVGMSSAETADALGLTVGSVRVTQHRAVRTLRSRLALPEQVAT